MIQCGGIMERLWDEGVRGKMWRVVKSMYSTVQSAVLIGDEKTEWFELYTGVRQGCVMSPILFSLFVNGLAREIKAVGKRSAGRETESAVVVLR
jgi:hypothetical protein